MGHNTHMLTHEGIWAAVDALAARHEMSASGLAKAAGLDPTTFNKSKRMSREGKPRWPSTESIAKILSATNSNLSDFVNLLDQSGSSGRSAQRLPVLPLHAVTENGHFNEAGQPIGAAWDEVVFPDMQDNDAFALEVQEDEYAPIYKDGDILILSPQAEIRRGDRVVARTTDGRIMLCALSRKTALRLEMQSIMDESKTELMDITDLDWLVRIQWVSQ